MRLPIIAALALLAATPAFAQAPESRADQYTTLTFSEQADRTVPRDRLFAYLRAEATDADPIRVQAEINRRMAKALEITRKGAAVKTETGTYSLNTFVDPQKQTQWRGTQQLTLHASDFDALLGMVRELQAAGLVMGGMNFDLLPETRRKLQVELEAEAVAKAMERARALAKAAGTSVAQVRAVRLAGGGYAPPRPVAMMKAEGRAAAMPAPVAEAGETTMSVSVDVEVWLAPVR
jgi:predicted secreted protein